MGLCSLGTLGLLQRQALGKDNRLNRETGMKASASALGCNLLSRFHRAHLGHAGSVLKPVLFCYDEAHVLKPQKTRQALTRCISQVSRPLTRQGPHMGHPDIAFPHDPALSAVELPESPDSFSFTQTASPPPPQTPLEISVRLLPRTAHAETASHRTLSPEAQSQGAQAT